MNLATKLGTAVVGALALVGAGTVGWTVANAGAPAQPQNLHPAAHPDLVRPVDSSTESKFTPIVPCRIADTRAAGGHLAVGATRSFSITSGVLSSQGGSPEGCGIPSSATAVAATVVAVNETGPGFLVAWPAGSPKPVSSFMNFANSNLVSSGATLAINGSLDMAAGVSSTDVVIDVDGYYVTPLDAMIASDGTKVSGARVTGSTRLGTGEYEVDFDRDVSGCTYSVTGYQGEDLVWAEPRTLVPDGVFVSISTTSVARNDQFSLDVTC